MTSRLKYFLQMNDQGNFENLPELHSLTCGLKALVTQAS